MSTEFKTLANNAFSTLASTLAIGGSSLHVATGEGGRFPSTGPFWVTLFGDTVEEGHEIVQVATRSTDTFSGLTRGEQSTSAGEWGAATKVQMLWTKGAVDQITDAITGLETGTTHTDLTYTQIVNVRSAGTSVTPTVTMNHSRGTIAVPTTTQSGDTVGEVWAQGYNSTGAAFHPIGAILFQPDGQAPATGDSPGKILIQTTADGTETLTTAITIDKAQKVTLAGDAIITGSTGMGAETAPSAMLHLKGTSSTAKELLYVEQLDTDEPFLRYQGTTAADTTKSLSTAVIGTFTYGGMVRVSINGTDRWMPYYS